MQHIGFYYSHTVQCDQVNNQHNKRHWILLYHIPVVQALHFPEKLNKQEQIL